MLGILEIFITGPMLSGYVTRATTSHTAVNFAQRSRRLVIRVANHTQKAENATPKIAAATFGT